MNVWVPQSYETLSELIEICSTEANFTTSQHSRPIIAMKQDAMTGGYLLTYGDVKIDKATFFDCLMCLEDFDVMGKTGHGIEYGGRISLSNDEQAPAGGGSNTFVDQAYVFLGGNYGKAIAGDHYGASDLFVSAPTIGLGQANGEYTDAVDQSIFSVITPLYSADDEENTKVTYMTPQLGNEQHKLQAAGSFMPNWNDKGQNMIKYRGAAAAGQTTSTNFSDNADNAPYKNVFEGTVRYTGSFDAVNVAAAAIVQTGEAENANRWTGASVSGAALEDFTAYGFGGQVAYAGFTVGGSWLDAGEMNTIAGQNNDQTVGTLGVSYGWDRFGLAFSWLTAEGYNNGFDNTIAQGVTANTVGGLTNVNYIDDLNVYGVGGTYNWFPGMSTNLDVVWFSQERADRRVAGRNISDVEGHVVMLGQKLEF
ncbi:MAG: porin [Alphaproteobacteria bacterium]|nr:porin [Alphaproteobacteria bacterium]